MTYKDVININKNFQYSVNIEYDLNNAEKIGEYIPTSDVCDVLKIYIKTILGKNKNEKRATLLVGPYGKGKSFLILTLLRLICFDKTKETETLLNKIKIVDDELYDLIQEIYKRNIKLLPIIIDSNYYNIEQSFLMAMNDALKNANLNDIIPNTIFDVCLNQISEWEKDSNLNEEVIKRCLSLNKINLNDLKKQLLSFDKEGYYNFEKLYNCVVKGMPLNPMINTDVVKMYSDINRQLAERGYSGTFIVYDEFSKTLEAKNSYLAHDLKLIQDFAEVANRSSSSEQIHMCCITHKTLDLYQGKSNQLSDDFKKVAGRFNEIRFNRSLDQNYQIISLTIDKKKSYTKTRDEFIKKNSWFYESIKKEALFDEKDERLLFDESFPMNPITEYALIRLSEMIAQNERTMFTLISDTDENSFNSFIANNGKGLYNVDKLYDYFSMLLQNEETRLKNIYLKCEAAIKKTTNNIEKSVLKVLAVFEMLDDYSKLAPTKEMISLALCIDQKSISETIGSMVYEEKILKIAKSSNYLSFAYSGTKEIDYEIDKFISTKGKSLVISDVLNDLNEKKYLIPRKYNAINKITRFFRIVFLEEDAYMNMTSFALLKEKIYCDGIIIRIIGNKTTQKKIKEHYNLMNENENIIVQSSKLDFDDIIVEAKNIIALMNILNKDDAVETLNDQIGLILSEKKKELNILLDNQFSERNVFTVSLFKEQNINSIASAICFEYYKKAPIVNNELINKQIVTSQYQKARNEIINRLLRNDYYFDDLSSTGAEMTVFNSFFTDGKLSKESEEIVKIIKTSFYNKNKEKICFNNIVKTLKNKPYGIKQGILPIYFALALANMSENKVLYFDNVEIEINAVNIDKVCLFPNKYYLLVENESKEQDEYLKKMLKVFEIEQCDSYNTNKKLCVEALKKWAISLPMIVKETKPEDNYLNLDKELIDLKNLLLKFDINPHELVFVDMPAVFDNSLDKTIKGIKKYKDISSFIDRYTAKLANEIIKMFNKNYLGHLNGSVRAWESENSINYNDIVFENKGKELYELFKNISHDDNEAINQISTVILGYRINDWANNNEKEIIDAINQYIDDSLMCVEESEKLEISALGKTFRNNIESVVDEFSDSISNKEKIQILKDIINSFTGEK